MKIEIREQDPLKQGLKLQKTVGSGGTVLIREQDPLKQGLKRMLYCDAGRRENIREQDPLKQGLKHISIALSFAASLFVSKIH
mgnify:FL=1